KWRAGHAITATRNGNSWRCQSPGTFPAGVQLGSAAIAPHMQRASAPKESIMKSNTLAVALAALLVGGVAIGAYHNSRDTDPTAAAGVAGEEARGLDYAAFVGVAPVSEKAELIATVIGSEPGRETTTSSSPRQLCEDVGADDCLTEEEG